MFPFHVDCFFGIEIEMLDVGEVIILLQRPNAIGFNQNLFRSE